MRRARRFPARLVRWTSLCVCLALFLSSLAMVPLPGSHSAIALAQGRSDAANSKGRKVSPAPPLTGAPAASLPSLDEARQSQNAAPQARPHVPSTMRSRRKPLESRQGRKVGDPLPPKLRASASETGDGSERVSVASADARNHEGRVGIVRSHHARTTRSLRQGAMKGDVRPLSLVAYLFKYPNVSARNHPAFNFLRYPGSHLSNHREAYVKSEVSLQPTAIEMKHVDFHFFAAPVPQAGSSKIVFTSNRDGAMQIYVMNIDGSGQTRLTYSGSNDDNPRWSPNGAKILFQSDRDNPATGYMDIYVMNPDGSGQTRLTSDANDDSAPVWSPDGTKIAFQSARNGVSYQVYVMNADGSGQVNVSNSTAIEGQPSWSPDGAKIAFASDPDHAGLSSVYVMNANGSSQTRLTFSGSGLRDEQPAWSSNGTKLAFTSTRDSIVVTWQETDDEGGIVTKSELHINKEVYLMNADGSNQIRLTNDLSNDDSPCWSSDGTKIIWRSDRERDCCDPTAQIWVMNPDGSNQVLLSSNEFGDYSPSWGSTSNQSPVANSGGPYTAVTAQTITFNGSGSFDPDGSIVSYAWNFGDGATGSGVAPTHAYATVGTYPVTLTVADILGGQGSATTTATISNQSPVANAGGPYSGAVSQAINFNGDGSSDAGGSIVNYAWNFGDGGTGSGVAPTHTYTTVGTYTVTLTVTDNLGAQSSATATASISTQTPVANPGGPYNGFTGQNVTFNGNGSIDPDGSIVNYSWNFGDGGTGSGVGPQHSYSAAGTYNVTLTVTDNLGAQASASTTVSITTATANYFTQNFIQSALAREPNSDEVNYWEDIFRAAHAHQQGSMMIAVREMARTIFESAEYAARGRSNHWYVYDLYKAYLMREPDAEGWAFWESVCDSYGRAAVRQAFDECTEFANEVAAITPNGSASSSVSSLATARVDPNNQPGNQLLARDAEWGVPLLYLPGRAGLDLGLGLSYSSAAVWTRSGPYLYFDEDIGTPSPGFRLSFPVVQEVFFDAQVGVNVRLMITSSGQRVEFRQVGTSNIYETADSSYLQLTDNGNSLTVRSTDGTQMSYAKYFDWRCTQIQDRNGNYLTINNHWWGDIANITDTLGRVITFNYDGNANLISITQTWTVNGAAQTHTWATFSWSNLTMQPSLPGVVGTHSGDVIPVLTQVGLDDGSRYTVEYNTNGQVNLIRRYRSDNVQRTYTAYDYAPSADGSPRLTGQRVSADNWTGTNGVPTEVVTQFSDPGDGSHVMTAPDGTIYKEFYGGGWQRGLTTQSEVWSGGSQQKVSTIAWTQDNTNVSYQTNPRVFETNVYDSDGNHSKTSVGYHTFALSTSGASCSLPNEVNEYEPNGTTIARRTHTDYNLDANYLNRRIIGLPQAKYLYEGASTLMAKTTYVYDWGGEYLQGLPAAPTQHDGSYSTDFVVGRGNLVDVLRWDVNDPNNATKALESTAGYNINGSVIFTRDALNHQTTIGYGDAFSDGNNRNTFAYPTTGTDADGYSSSVQYNYDFGAKTRVQGPPPAGQSQGLIQTFAYDNAARIQQATTTNTGAYQRYVYGPNYVQRYSSVNNIADDLYAIQVFDGAGRTFASAGYHPGSSGGFTAVSSIYDSMGRLFKQSNATEITGGWLPTGDDQAGWIFTQQTYDWKGRPLFTTNTDGTQKSATYSACGCAGSEIVTLTDEVGRQQKVYSDVLGRTAKTEVLTWNGTVYATTVNTFNGRDQVTLVRQYQGNDQSGIYQDTSMSYDGYGRLHNKHAPEQNSGTATTYAYNTDDTVQSVTDARGAICTYGYNARHQVSSATHVLSGQTIALSYGYDAAGNRTSMTDNAGSVSYHYDQLSRMDWEERTFTGLGTYRLSYGYNLAGQLTSLTEPSQFGGVVSYAHDAAGRLTDMTGSGFGATTQFATGIQYRASGTAKHVSYGSGAQLNVNYNGRLLPTRYELGNLSQGTMGTENQFYADGRIQYAQDLQNGNLDRAYEYDHAGRIKEAFSGREARGEPPLPYPDNPFRQSYSYDAWSNMGRTTNRHWSANLPDTPTYTNNRRGGWVYDASGQVVSRDSEQKLHTYDATGQETHYWEQIFHPQEPWFNERNTIDQIYDGDGRRVKRIENRERENAGGTETESDTTYYLSSSVLGGATVAEIDVYGGRTKGWVYAGGEKLAEFMPNGYVGWRHVNPVTGVWVNSGTGFTNRNELDPLGTDVGTGDPYVSVTATYSDMMGPVSLYEERGNPFDPGGGCGTLDGLPISCSEKRQRMTGGSITQEVTLTNGGVLRLAIRHDGVGIQPMLRPNELKRVSRRDFLLATLELNDPLGGLGDDFTSTENHLAPSPQLNPTDFRRDLYTKFQAAINKCLSIFGKSARLIPTQTFSNSPRLNVTKTGTELAKKVDFRGFDPKYRKREPVAGIPQPNEGPNGTVYLASEQLKDPDITLDILEGEYIHELGNILSYKYAKDYFRFGDKKGIGQRGDRDTGANFQKCVFPSSIHF